MKTTIGLLFLLSSFTVQANECADLSGKYFVEDAEKNCSIEMIVGGEFNNNTVGYSPFLMGFAVDLKFNNGYAARAGNNRAFEWKQKSCKEITLDSWAYQQLSYTGINVDLNANADWNPPKWIGKELVYKLDFSSKYHYGRYRHVTEAKYSSDENGNLVYNYHYVDQRGPKKRRFEWTTIAEYKAKCVFKKEL